MLKRFVAILSLSVWLILLGMEAGEQAGYFEFPDQEVDSSVDITLLSLGTALQLAEGGEETVPDGVLFPLHCFDASREAPKGAHLTVSPQPPPQMGSVPFRKIQCRFLI